MAVGGQDARHTNKGGATQGQTLCTKTVRQFKDITAQNNRYAVVRQRIIAIGAFGGFPSLLERTPIVITHSHAGLKFAELGYYSICCT